MRNSIGILAAALFLGLTASIANAAESKAVQTMAGILMNLHHFPSDSDKQALVQITEDKSATADERTVDDPLSRIDVEAIGRLHADSGSAIVIRYWENGGAYPRHLLI
jgi:type II secretory pathway pseudopilin PulG